jgi:hypothetical protein
VRIGLQRRIDSLTIRGNYTARVAYSDVSQDPFGMPANNYDMSPEWGPVAPKHGIQSSLNLTLPWNAESNLALRWSSGAPYDLQTGLDDNRDTHVTDRPAGVNRNSLEGPSYFEVDLGLSRTFTMFPSGVAGTGGQAGVRATVSVEGTNLLNRAGYSQISGILTSPFFGLPVQARQGRQIFASLELGF